MTHPMSLLDVLHTNLSFTGYAQGGKKVSFLQNVICFLYHVLTHFLNILHYFSPPCNQSNVPRGYPAYGLFFCTICTSWPMYLSFFFLISRTDTSFEHFCHFSPPCNQSYIPTGYLVHGPFSVLSAPKGENIYILFTKCWYFLQEYVEHLGSSSDKNETRHGSNICNNMLFISMCVYVGGGGGLNGRTDTFIGLD